MRFWAIVAFLPVAAFGVTVETLQQSEYADTEVSTNIPFAVSFDAMSRMNFSISLEASPSNCVEVSIGTDADGDGVLSLDEMDQTFGYNCGTWFQRDSARELFDCSIGRDGTGREDVCFEEAETGRGMESRQGDEARQGRGLRVGDGRGCEARRGVDREVRPCLMHLN